MKKERVMRLTGLLLSMGVWGSAAANAQAVDLTINSLDEYNQMRSEGILSHSGTNSRPMASDSGNHVTVDLGDDTLIGNGISAGSGEGNTLEIYSGTFKRKEGEPDTGSLGVALCGSSGGTVAKNNTVIIHDGMLDQNICGGEAGGKEATVTGNRVYIHGGTVGLATSVIGGWLTDGTEIRDNSVFIDGTVAVHKTVYGGVSKGDADTSGNTVQIGGSATATNVYGGRGDGTGTVSGNQVTIQDSAKVDGMICGGNSVAGSASQNKVSIGGEAVVNTIRGGSAGAEGQEANENVVEISGGTVSEFIEGGNGWTANGNQVILSGGTISPVDDMTSPTSVYGGRSSISGGANDNTVTLKGNVDVSAARLYGANLGGTGNTLVIDGWNSGSAAGNAVLSAQNFNAIQFTNLNWKKDGIALDITNAASDGELTGTAVSVENLTLASGTPIQAGDTMTFIRSNMNTGLSLDNVSVMEDVSFSQGVATVGELEMKLEGETHNLVGEIKGVGLNSQTTAIAENRTAAAAFLNQGADIAADSLDLLGSDYKYGLRTFGAVYGSRSTYDAAGDLKINGWSEIVGLGNVHRKGDGDLSWGVFYENGTGNYRTWNEFNNEMFRGDGSLLYNGGGAAVRYQKDDGWYYEASVRAGTLSASMDNAVKDGNGNSYGFDSDSTYWGAHAGVGKVIETERGEWNVYGKYFHTAIDGDSFTIDGDRFEFDSLTSDRLRIGARYTADKAKRWSLYYGLAWEYEFTGDSHMRAAGMNAPEQSLGGSTGIAEIGTVWQPDDSPWQANINLKGYAGEREGVSGMAQLAYTF